MSYREWLAQVQVRLQWQFGLAVEDVASAAQLQQYHADGETPEQLCARVEAKYNLTRRSALNW